MLQVPPSQSKRLGIRNCRRGCGRYVAVAVAVAVPIAVAVRVLPDPDTLPDCLWPERLSNRI